MRPTISRPGRARGWLLAALAALGAAASPEAGAVSGGELGVQGVDHVGMNVPDIDEAVRFFSALVGTRVVLDVRPAPVGADWKRRFSWHASSRIERIVMLRTATGEQFELFQYAGAEISRRQPHEDDAAATHIALRVADIDAGLAAVRRRGLRVLCEPVTNPDGTRWFYFLTPWNAQLELVTPPHPKP